MSVRNDVRIRLMARPRMVTCSLCPPGLNMTAQMRTVSNGRPLACANSHAASCEQDVVTCEAVFGGAYAAVPSRRGHEGSELRCYPRKTCDEMVG